MRRPSLGGGSAPVRQPRGGAVSPQLRLCSPGAAQARRGSREERLRQPGSGWLGTVRSRHSRPLGYLQLDLPPSAGGCCTCDGGGMMGLSEEHGCLPAASLLSGVTWMQSKGFPWTSLSTAVWGPKHCPRPEVSSRSWLLHKFF